MFKNVVFLLILMSCHHHSSHHHHGKRIPIMEVSHMPKQGTYYQVRENENGVKEINKINFKQDMD